MRPLIGVSCDGEYGDRPDLPVRYTLSRSYVEAIRRAGGAVVTIPSCTDAELLRPVYSSLSGLLLSGGDDIRPALFRQADLGVSSGVDPERDDAEMLLARWAMEDDLPIFAICRGIQMLNVALGGDLIQDIATLVQGALVHSPMPKPPRCNPQHAVTVALGSRLATILGQGRPLTRVDVNSFHHQAVGEVAPALRVAARAPDDIIEGLECPDRSFVLAVQWHPEEMAATCPEHAALFAAFVAACAGRRGRG